jgi:hypothetical protein
VLKGNGIMTLAEPGIILLEDPDTRYAVHSDPEAFRSWQLLFWPSTIPAKQGYSGLLIEEMIFQVSEEHQKPARKRQFLSILRLVFRIKESVPLYMKYQMVPDTSLLLEHFYAVIPKVR